jgi:L-lactate dehydrogenase complex protein LldE
VATRPEAARGDKDADLVQTRRVYDAARMRVALFATCLVDALFPDAGKATVTLLERLGQPLEFPLEQTCCGQMHANSGYFEPNLVRRYVDVFEPYDAVVVPSGSCAGAIRHQHQMIARAAGDEALANRAEAVGRRTYELSEFLIDVLQTDNVGAYFPHRVTYHPTCHSLRMLGVGDRPLRLLNNVRGIELVTLPHHDECCGFGGTFSIKNPDVSAAMLADKMEAVIETGAEVLCAGDRSCLMHIGGGLDRIRAGVKTLHLAEILASTERTATA